MSAVYVRGIGVLGPGMCGWRATREILAGRQAYRHEAPQTPNPLVLPATERRRGAKTVRWAVAVASEALENVDCDASGVATVFASSSGDGETLHQLCETLATHGREVSPIRFHNSVHNAAAGYWSIAAQSRRPSVTLCGHDGSFAAGLLEATAQALTEPQPVLLVAYDLPYPQPLHAVRWIAEPFAVAILLTPPCAGAMLSRWNVTFETGRAAPSLPPEFPATLLTNPAAHALSVLAAIAKGDTVTVQLHYGHNNHVRVESSPCS